MRNIVIILVLLIFSSAFAAEFGEFSYQQYMGVVQQIQNQRAIQARRARMYNSNPMRNIQFPTSSNPYPNIQKSYSKRLSARQRYSVEYYNKL